MANKKNTLQVVVGSILILLLIGVTVLLISEKRANNELVQEFNLEKEDLENQYTDFAKQYDELKLTVSNDSLSVLLEQEQLKTQRLLEELRTVKSTNATEIRRLKKELELEQQHAQLVKQLEEDYEQRRNDMEPQIVEALLAVFTEVTHTVSEDNKEIVLHLINNVLKNVENSHSYSIKVSPDDYNFVLNNQGKIYCAMNNEVNLDIVQDMALKQNECMIETDSGVFNCSLDVELHNLIKQIKLLSCM